ncbi:hypothetical protein G3I29_19000 [Streptomyces halstedii]|uniref:Uncharacterized protein n=1 Tax=Streptomyces halstedii TaxID=1944 RepID=A0A6N9U1D7_STRHA|nr:hypothetical protein [Streptomyces halstedii]
MGALLVPVLLVLMMFGLDALENFLFPRHPNRSVTDASDVTDAGEPPETL